MAQSLQSTKRRKIRPLTVTKQKLIHKNHKKPLSCSNLAILSSSRSRGSLSRLKFQKCSPQSTDSLKDPRASSMKASMGRTGCKLNSFDCQCCISRMISAARCLLPKLIRFPGRTSLLPSWMKVRVVRYTPYTEKNVSLCEKGRLYNNKPMKGIQGGLTWARVAL